ncbi:MAG: UDP-glucose/GDP-mannose dehydrogenase family protein [Polyangiaceae bacterium]|nr:UDP-glucose/GDP-mannose dehydrogenase family protein [Polyangiaceae bacterium]
MKIAIVGSGYVGLVAGACFADVGVDVVCVDVDEKKLERLRRGEVPFFEPRLDDLVKKNHPERLTFSSNLKEAIAGRSVVFIAVGTPPNEDGSADLKHVLKVAEDVARLADDDLALVLKSTVPVGTNAKVREVVAAHTTRHIGVVSNPEFLKEGDAVNDFLKPDRIVVGTDDDHAFELVRRLYAPFNRQKDRLHRMSPASAEIVKYAANALLATKISFMNEIARLCEVAGADVEHVRLAVGADERIGLQFLYPGLGFGGSCFPKDLRALVHTGRELGVPLLVAEAATRANEAPVHDLLGRMGSELAGLSGKVIAVWGLAFKPRTDDVREAASLRLIRELVASGARIRATDPEASATAAVWLQEQGIRDSVEIVPDLYETCRGADAVVLATEWHEFRAPDFTKVAELLRGKLLYDGRNVLDGESAAEAGLRYRAMGRPARG